MFAFDLRRQLRIRELRRCNKIADQLFVDVRKVSDYQLRHLPSAVSLPLDLLEDHASALLDPSRILYVYGRNRTQALLACVILQDLGYQAVSIGTMRAWPYDTITSW